jgi:hypothetical protein
LPDWTQLRHAYGSAEDLPDLLREMSPDPSAPVWNELWSCLCHQDTVYSASFAALPVLLEVARRWLPRERVMILGLAGAILASDDVMGGSRDELLKSYEWTIPSFEHLAQETISTPESSASDFIYAAQAILVFRNEMFWGRQLEDLVSGNFKGICPACGTDLYLVVGEYGFFSTAQERADRPKGQVPITPADPENLASVSRWLYEQSLRSGQPAVAEWVRHLFGTTACPSCGHAMSVEEGVHAWVRRWARHAQQ